MPQFIVFLQAHNNVTCFSTQLSHFFSSYLWDLNYTLEYPAWYLYPKFPLSVHYFLRLLRVVKERGAAPPFVFRRPQKMTSRKRKSPRLHHRSPYITIFQVRLDVGPVEGGRCTRFAPTKPTRSWSRPILIIVRFLELANFRKECRHVC
jgi:hypothetical protein